MVQHFWVSVYLRISSRLCRQLILQGMDCCMNVRLSATTEPGFADFQGVCVLSAQVINTAVPTEVCSATAEGQVCRSVSTAEI